MKRQNSKATHTTKDGRLILSPTDWRKMKAEMWEDLSGYGARPFPCGICHQLIGFLSDFEPDHIKPRGMGGGFRDDKPENIQPSHRWCNREKRQTGR